METQTRQVSPKIAKQVLKKAMSKQRPIFLWGPPGIGKSDIVHQIGSEIEALVIDIRLSLWDPTDIKGIPYYNQQTNKMEWGIPQELPDESLANQHKYIILFLDEMNSANPAVQAAAYQLVLNRRIGTYILPDNVLIVAAGNRMTDRGVTYKMPSPLANRFLHIELKVNFEDWFDWAIKNKINRDVVSFLEFSKHDLYDFDPKSPNLSFATPRSWSFVSDLLNDTETSNQFNVPIDSQIETELVASSIGEGLALKFMAHREMSNKLPNPSDILNGKPVELKTREISALYSLTLAMCYELKELNEKRDPNLSKKINNYLKYSMDHFETELVVMGLKLAITKYMLPIDPDEIDCFDEFHERYGRYIHSAVAGD
jgi:hypothetical protein